MQKAVQRFLGFRCSSAQAHCRRPAGVHRYGIDILGTAGNACGSASIPFDATRVLLLDVWSALLLPKPTKLLTRQQEASMCVLALRVA